MEAKLEGKPLLLGRQIKKSYGEAAVLNGIDIELQNGDFTVIMGTSGSGKSTLLYVLSGMEQASGGSILFEETDIASAPEKELTKLRADAFGFVFQKTHLISNLTLYENILMAGLIGSKWDEKTIREKADALISQMNLQEAKDRLPSQVSGGEAQRAAVARAVSGAPTLLFADEPTGALNRANTKEVLDLFTTLHQEGQTILLVTHDKEAALRGNRIFYLEDGKILSKLDLSDYKPEDKQREEKLSMWLNELGW